MSLKIIIGLISGDNISVTYSTNFQYEELVQSWEISKRMFGKKFIDISDLNNPGRIMTIYLPDIVFVRKDDVKDIDV